MIDPTESDIRRALRKLERALRADPRLSALIEQGQKCPDCGSADGDAIPGGRMRRCRRCDLIWVT